MSLSPSTLRTPPGVGDDQITHVTCCTDDDIALCGLDVTDHEFVDQHSVTCVDCGLAELRDYCPLRRVCPP